MELSVSNKRVYVVSDIHNDADGFKELLRLIKFGEDDILIIKDYPNAYHQFENEVTLPLHTRLTDEDVEYIIDNFVGFISR